MSLTNIILKWIGSMGLIEIIWIITAIPLAIWLLCDKRITAGAAGFIFLSFASLLFSVFLLAYGIR